MRARVVAIVLTIALPGTVLASDGECSQTIRPSVIHDLVEEGRTALFDDDRVGFAAVHAEVVARIPCMDGVIEPRIWAKHLITLAVDAYHRNLDWQGPLTSALVADPLVDRAVGMDHPIATWSPSTTLAEGGVVPADRFLWVDGRPVRFEPNPIGPHLYQMKVEDELHSIFVVDAGVPSDWWASAKTEKPNRRDDPKPVREPDPKGPDPIEPDGTGGNGKKMSANRPRFRLAPTVGGIALAGVGTVIGYTAYRDGLEAKEDGDNERYNRALTRNIIGWSMTGVGVGIVFVDGVTPGRLRTK